MTFLSFLIVLICATQALGSEQPVGEHAAESAAEAGKTPQAPKPEAELTKECNLEEALVEEPKVFTGGFGPHCSSPSFTCTLEEPGLGFGCTCTYSCDCAYCNGKLTQINCVLVDDGGCFSCPLPNGW